MTHSHPTVVFVGEALGEHEARLGRPFVGPSGLELLRTAGEAGLIALTAIDRDYLSRWWASQDPAQINAVWDLHPEVARTNVFNLHPPGNDLDHLCGPKFDALPGWPALAKSRYVTCDLAPELNRLGAELREWRPNIIVALGNTPLWALCGRSGVKNLRGTVFQATHLVPGAKVLSTFHPAYIARQYESRPILVADLMKARREALSPTLQRPAREIWIEPSLDDIADFIREFIPPGSLVSVDIETVGDRVTCIGFAPSPERAIVVPFDDARQPSRSYWHSTQAEAHCWALIRGVLEDGRVFKLFQNGLYDIAFLWRSMRVRVLGATEDTMLLHHALQPEMLKGLGFLGSLYSDERSWKGMRQKAETTTKRDA